MIFVVNWLYNEGDSKCPLFCIKIWHEIFIHTRKCIPRSNIYAAGTVYLVLVSVSGLAVIFVWIAISLCELIFRRRILAAGHQLSELKYRTPWYPVVPWFAFIASSLSCILIWFDPQQRIALYCTIPFVIACYAAYYLQTLWRKYTTKKKVSTVVK